MDFTTNPGSGTANYRVPDPDSVAAFIPSSDQCIPAPTLNSCAGHPATSREGEEIGIQKRNKAAAMLRDISGAMNTLYKMLRIWDEPYSIISVQASPWRKEREVFLSHTTWADIYSTLTDWPHSIEPHCVDDHANDPIEQQSFKLTFQYNEVEYFCLMSGKEVLENGFQLPV